MNRRAREGYSLVELLISLAIGLVIGGTVITLMVSQIQLSAVTNRNVMNQENIREVIQFMCDEIRLAATTDGTEPITLADSNAMSFSADSDGNDVSDLVEYYMNGSALMRRYSTTISGTPFVAEDVLLSHVQSVAFTYYALDDAAPADISEITSVELELQLDISAHSTAPTSGKLAPQVLIGRATIRNKLL